MATAYQASPSSLQQATLLERFSFPRQLALGYVGLLLFMMGDGVESGYLAHFLHGEGISQKKIALLFTVYGALAAMGARYSGALSDVWGPRLVMWIGLFAWTVFQVIFLGFSLPTGRFPHDARELRTPRLWLSVVRLRIPCFDHERHAGEAARIRRGMVLVRFQRGTCRPWVLFLLVCVIPYVGQYVTFWCALAMVIVGGVVALSGLPRRARLSAPGEMENKTRGSLFASVTIAWEKPKTAIGCLVRMINTAPQFGFLVFLPTFFTTVVGLRLSQWLQLLSYMFLSNIIANLLSGIVGDKLGWRRTVAYVGGIGCTITTLLLYYVPIAHRGNFRAGRCGRRSLRGDPCRLTSHLPPSCRSWRRKTKVPPSRC